MMSARHRTKGSSPEQQRRGILWSVPAAAALVAAGLVAVVGGSVAIGQEGVSGICGRTQKVQDTILGLLADRSACADVTDDDLATITGKLTLSDMNVTSLKAGDFAGLSGVTHLDLSDNAITTLHEDVFDGLSGLKELRLTFTKLTTLPEDIFENLTNLEVLYLYKNELTTLPENLFDGLTKLKDLNFVNNAVAALPEELFDGLTKLIRLSIIGNALTTLPEEIFDGPENLVYLELHKNQIAALPEEVFDGLDNLGHLYLSRNQIAALPANVFDGLDRLEVLLLFRNQLTALPADVFDGLDRLRNLSLSHNQISTLPDGLFEGIDTLEEVTLASNPGTPFSITAQLEQRDNSVVVNVAAGAPFPMPIVLSASGGTLASSTVTVAAGSLESDPVAVTANPAQTRVTVSITTAGFATTAGPNNYIVTRWGVEAAAGQSVTLAFNVAATGAPTISGTKQVGHTLTASTSGIADANGLTNVDYRYQWISNDTDIAGATNSTYSLQATDANNNIKVRVDFDDDDDYAETLTSAAFGPIAPGGM